jgi:hypothetical protein
MSRLAGRLSRLMVGLYPRRWRRRYGEELLALLEEHPSSPRTVASLALGAVGTHLDPGYRREGIAMSGPGSPLRMAAAVTGLAAALVVVVGGLLALDVWNEQRTDGVLTSDHSAGLAVSPNTRLGVTTQADGIGFVIVWRIGAHPAVLSHFTAGAPVAFVPGGQTVLATTTTAVTEWSLANPAKPVRIATLPGLGMAQAIACAPDQSTVAIAYPRAVVLWDLTRPAAPHRIATIPATAAVPGPDAAPPQDQIAFSPDGRTLATTTARHTVSLWDLSTPSAPQYLATLGRDTGPVAALAFSPAAPQLAYLSENSALTVVDLTDPAHQTHASMPGITGSAGGHSYALAYSPDGTRLTAVGVGGHQLATCTWTVTSPSQPLPATCRTGHTHLDGEITFTPGGTAIVGPNPHWANRPQNPLIIWPTLLG